MVKLSTRQNHYKHIIFERRLHLLSLDRIFFRYSSTAPQRVSSAFVVRGFRKRKRCN